MLHSAFHYGFVGDDSDSVDFRRRFSIIQDPSIVQVPHAEMPFPPA